MSFVERRPFSLLGCLFRNGSHKQVILKNTFWLSVAEGLNAVFNVFLVVYVIRVLGPTEYGKFAFGLSVVLLFSTLFDFGLSTAVTREFAGRPEEERHLSDILTLKTLLGAGVILLIAGFSVFVTQDASIRKVILVLCLYGLALEGVSTFYAFFRSRQQMEIEAAYRVLQIVLLGISVAAVFLWAPSIFNLSLAYSASTVVTLLIILVLFRRDGSISLRPAFNRTVWKRFLLIGLYLALAKGAGDVMTYIDSVLLGYFGMVTETGLYNGALKVNKLVQLPMGFVTAALFPTLIAIFRESSEKFTKYYRAWMKGSIFFSVMVLFVVLAEADRILVFLFSADFLPAATALRLLTVMAVLVYISNIYYHVLLISGQQKRIFYVFLGAAVLNIVLNVLLIPRLGINGAAAAAAGTYFVVLCQDIFLSWKHTIVKPVERSFLLTFGAALISGLLIWWGASALGGLNLFVVLFLAVAIYSLLFTGLNRIGQYLMPRVDVG